MPKATEPRHESPPLLISHVAQDRPWAEWVAWQLKDAGHTIELAMQAGTNIVLASENALQRGRVVALLSTAYLTGDHLGTAQWTAALAAGNKLLPIRIDECSLPHLLASMAVPTLANCDEEQARQRLLAAISGQSATDKPAYPGGAEGALRKIGGSGPRLPGSLPRVWNLPSRNPGFTGRDTLLIKLREALTTDTRVAVTALRGRGGVGKSQISIEYAHRFAGEYDLVWWVRAHEPLLIPDQMAALAVKTGAADKDTGSAEALEALAEELRTRRRWLLIFDNAEDPPALSDFLFTGDGHVLITSRSPHWQDRATVMDIDGFVRTESRNLLQSRVPTLSTDDADNLADLLEDLPLALAQAAALFADGLTLQQYLLMFDTDTARVLDRGRPAHYPATLATQIRLNCRSLAEAAPAAEALLRACAMLAPEPFPIHACGPAAADTSPHLTALLNNPLDMTDALHALSAHAMARIQNGTVHLHRLTQAVIRAQLTDTETAHALRSAEALLVAVTPDDPSEPATWPRWADLLPHLLDADPAGLTTTAGRRAVRDACWYLMERGSPAAALPRLQHMHHTWSTTFGPDHQDSLWAAVYLARALGDTGDGDRARTLDKNTVARMRTVLGKDHPDTLRTQSNLVNRLAKTGDLAAARELSEQTLQQWRQVRGDDHQDTLRMASTHITLLAATDETVQARELAEDTLRRQQQVLGETHRDTLHTALNLARRLAEEGRVRQAHILGEKTLHQLNQVLGHDHPTTLLMEANLAVWLADLGDLETARARADETLRRQQQILGPDHPDTHLAIGLLARLPRQHPERQPAPHSDCQ